MEFGKPKISGATKLANHIYHKFESKKNQQQFIELYKKQYGGIYNDSILYTSYLTGLHPNAVLQLENGMPDYKIQELDRASILSELKDFYLQKGIMPTTRQLFDSLQTQGKLAPYVPIFTFRKKLAQMDFVWKNIPHYTFVVMEKPEVVYERYKYLKTLMDCQEERMPIYFIDEIDFPGYDNKFKVIYALCKTHVSYKLVNALNENEIKAFIRHNIVTTLGEKSVIVLRNYKHYCEKNLKCKPSLDSLICNLKEWLDRYGVPYTEEMSKAELYCLVQKCTNVDDSNYVIDNILSSYGHTVLRIPEHIDMLTPTILFSNYVKDYVQVPPVVQKTQDKIVTSFESANEILLGPMYDAIMEEKKKLLDDDIRVDNVLDSLIVKMGNYRFDGDEDSDLPSGSESD